MGSTTSVKLEVTPNYWKLAKGSFLILLWLSILEFPLYVVGTGIDASWARALGYFFTRQMQAGVDFIFTYGPLGFLNTGAYVQDLFWLRYGYQILLQLLLVYYLSTSVNEKIKPGIWLVCFAFFIVFLGGAHGDDQKLFLIALIGIHLIDDKKTLFSILLSFFILGVLSLTKFTFFGLSVFVVLCAEAHGRLKNLKSLFSPLLLFLLIYFLIYFLAGQSFSAFPTYIKGAIEISSGYNKSMVLEGPPVETIQALVTLGAILMMILGTLRSANRNSIVKLIMIAMTLTLSWKQGFTRQDSHTNIFWGCAIFFTLLIILHFNYLGTPFLLRRFTALFALIGGILGCFDSFWNQISILQEMAGVLNYSSRRIQHNANALLFPATANSRLKDEQHRFEQKSTIPVLSKTVQHQTIDMISYQQNVLLLNKLNWTPRPVFQSYSAYTPYLAERNAEFIRSEKAPDFFLFRLQPLDNRFPTMDDNLALLEILRRYYPVEASHSFLLLQRKTVAPLPPLTTFKNEWITFEQEYLVPSRFRFQVLSLQIQPTAMGILRGIFYRSPYLFITVQTRSGRKHTFRLIPDLSREGFLLTPFIRSTADFVRLYELRQQDVVTSFTVTTQSPGTWFKNQILLELRGTDHLPRRTKDPNQLRMIRASLQNE